MEPNSDPWKITEQNMAETGKLATAPDPSQALMPTTKTKPTNKTTDQNQEIQGKEQENWSQFKRENEQKIFRILDKVFPRIEKIMDTFITGQQPFIRLEKIEGYGTIYNEVLQEIQEEYGIVAKGEYLTNC